MSFVVDVIRAMIRIIAFALMVLAIFAVGLLVNAVVMGDGRLAEPLGRVWYRDDVLAPIFHSPSIQLFQVFFERKLGIAVPVGSGDHHYPQLADMVGPFQWLGGLCHRRHAWICRHQAAQA